MTREWEPGDIAAAGVLAGTGLSHLVGAACDCLDRLDKDLEEWS